MLSRVKTIVHKVNSYRNIVNIHSEKKFIFLLAAIIFYSILCRLIPATLISMLVVLSFVAYVAVEFYIYVNHNAKLENKHSNTIEYSWGHVKEKTSMLDLQKFFQYILTKDLSFYKKFVIHHKENVILFIFTFGDMLVAFKNLSFFYSGSYFALSIFVKFVFVGYFHLYKIYESAHITRDNAEEKVLDIFYSQINGLISVFFVLFITVFILSKYIVEIFFGVDYMPLQSSLPFILLANMFLCGALCIFETARRMDSKMTNNIIKIYSPFFAVLFVFMSINYIDTITYFIIGATSILSIFLYNFVIKKPQYIADTYNHLF